MGDDEACASFHQVIHGLLNEHFGSCIYGAGGLIQNKDFRIRQNGSCNGKKLFLSLRDIACLFVQLHVVAAGQSLYEAVYMGGFRCLDDFFVCGVKSAVADIFHDCSVEQPGILKHHSEHFP